MSQPAVADEQRNKRVGRYLRGGFRAVVTCTFQDETEPLTVMSDADVAGDLQTMRVELCCSVSITFKVGQQDRVSYVRQRAVSRRTRGCQRQIALQLTRDHDSPLFS